MDTLKKLLKYAPEKRVFFHLSILLSIVSTIIGILPFYYLWLILNEVLLQNNLDKAKSYALTVVFLMIAKIIVYLASLWCSHLLAFRIETNMKKLGATKLLDASFSFFDTHSSGVVRKTIDDNTGLTHTLVAHLVPDIANAILFPFLLIGTIFFVNKYLGFYVIGVVIISLVLIRFMFGNMEFQKKYMKSLDDMNGEIVEYVRNIQVVKIFNTSIDSYKKLYNYIMNYSKLAFNYTISCRIPYVLFQVVLMVFVTATVPVVASHITDNNMGKITSDVIFFACFAGMLFNSFMKIMMVGQNWMNANNCIVTLENLFDEMENKKLVSGTEKEMNSFDIEFKNVTFSYEKDINVLENLSFKLDQGKTYALVGSSGGGKSSIAKLISGFYKIDSGQILIGNKDITSYEQDTLLKNIAFVFQNTKLFKTSIYDNVLIGKQSATYDEVMNAMKLAKCDDILDKFETREQTIIGSKGIHLSGGEVQRIGIARAILKNANIIILDEASAAADPENEYEIQQAFTNLMQDKTVIMIAHRLSSIKNVDEIIVIDDGKIIERGDNKTLMQIENGRYKNLYSLFEKANEWRVAI